MKRTYILLAALSLNIVAYADTYSYLSFQSADGTTRSVAAESLSMTFSDSGKKLVATNGSDTYTFDVNNLQRMFFTASDLTGIKELTSTSAKGDLRVYTVSGTYIGRFANDADIDETLAPGIYLVKKNGKTSKIAVK